MSRGWRTGHAGLLDALENRGHLRPGWRPAFEATPRHLFIPERVWRMAGRGFREVDRAQEPDAWWELVYSDEPVVTQLNDGRPRTTGGAADPTSSSSMPSMVAKMLHHLDLAAGHTVLEVGAGTGWNAALLAHRGAVVTTVELDPDVAAQARRALTESGIDPAQVGVVDGDGEGGWAPAAPYDRLIGTFSVRSVPHAWVGQTRPGGVIVTPLHAGAVVRLTVAEDGTAAGPFVTGSSFMLSRPQRDRMTHVPPGAQSWKSPTDLDTRAVANVGFLVYLHAHHPELHVALSGPPAAPEATVLDGEGSAAQADGTGTVWEYGPRALWERIEQLHQGYSAEGRPDLDRFGLTVTSTGQRVWLDEPDHALASA
ncbi:methyltransferase domain-containing protein [Streptomyces mayteni]